MIDEIVAIEVRIPLTRTFRIAVGASNETKTLIIGVRSGEIRGFGEAPASLRLSGETIGGIADSLDMIHNRLLKAETRHDVYEILDRIHGGPAMKAGIEGALRDLISKKYRISPKDLRNTSDGVRTDMTVSLDDPRNQAKEAEEFIKQGFKALKIKLDGNEEKNIKRLKAIREVAPDVELRIDFNTSLRPSRAYKHMRELERFEIELFEQPVKNMFSILPNKLDTPLFADESASTVQEAIRLIEAGIDGIVIKLAKHGLEGGRFIIEYAKRHGALTLVGCTSETGIGTAFLTAMAASGATYADIDSDVHLTYKIDETTFPKEGFRRVPDRYFTSIEKPEDIKYEYVERNRRWIS